LKSWSIAGWLIEQAMKQFIAIRRDNAEVDARRRIAKVLQHHEGQIRRHEKLGLTALSKTRTIRRGMKPMGRLFTQEEKGRGTVG
jgi:hypothetical protein